MSTDEKYNMKGLLSDLLARAKEREELDLVLLRNEIRKEIEAGDKTLQKFLELVESFQEVLPKEKQRYNVAIRALYTTSRISRQNVLESTDNQLEELRKLEKGVLSDLTGFRDELNDMDARLEETKSELTKLREKIAHLEKEEEEILVDMAARESERKVVEEAVRKVFTDVATDIDEVRKKVEEFTAEKASPQPAARPDSIAKVSPQPIARPDSIEEVSPQPIARPDSIESHRHGEEEGGAEEEGKIEETFTMQETSEMQESEWLKKCPICGGQINFLVNEAKWMCYSCGHEESARGST